MSQFPINKGRSDGPYTTSIRPLGNGKIGARVLRDGIVIMKDHSARTMSEAVKALRECLRMVDKCGYDCRMADKSRDRYGRKGPR